MKRAEVDTYLKNAGTWKKPMTELRRIALDSGLEETFKWRQPCYAAGGTNVAIIQGFKDRCALMFFQGSLLKDPKGLLEAPGKNSHVARRMVFTSADEVWANEKPLRRFLAEARKLAASGAKVETKPDPDPLPAEMKALFREVKGLRKAFEALTPGRRRGYVLHVSGAKQAKTRRARMEKCVPRILAGKGLDDPDEPRGGKRAAASPKRPRTVEEYIRAAPKQGQPHLRRLHALLRGVAPRAEEAIKWGTPMFVEPRFLFAFSAHKGHLNFTPNVEALEAFAGELEGRTTTKGSLQVRYDEPLPEDLIRRMAKHRVKVVAEREDDGFW